MGKEQRKRTIERILFQVLRFIDNLAENKTFRFMASVFGFLCTLPTLVEGDGFAWLVCVITDLCLLCVALGAIRQDDGPDSTDF